MMMGARSFRKQAQTKSFKLIVLENGHWQPYYFCNLTQRERFIETLQFHNVPYKRLS